MTWFSTLIDVGFEATKAVVMIPIETTLDVVETMCPNGGEATRVEERLERLKSAAKGKR